MANETVKANGPDVLKAGARAVINIIVPLATEALVRLIFRKRK